MSAERDGLAACGRGLATVADYHTGVASLSSAESSQGIRPLRYKCRNLVLDMEGSSRDAGEPEEEGAVPDVDGGDDASGGYMFLLPSYLPAELKAARIITGMLPWMAPAFFGLTGTILGDPPSPALAVTFEWPISWLRTPDPLSKFEREWLYLRRYSADQALVTGAHAFSKIEPGADPPDAQALTDQGIVGVESTALTLEERRGVHGLFLQLRRRLIEQDPNFFTKLVGHAVYVWFEDPDTPGLAKPHKRSDGNAVDELLRELAEYEPDSQQLWVPSDKPPQQAPPLPLAKTASGARFYAFPLLGAVPNSMLYTVAGFDVGVAHTTLLTAQAAWGEVQRLVDSHDKPGVDFLLITAGAPDHRGNIFPAEEAVAHFLISNPIGLSRPPTHIEKIVLHIWTTGQATHIHPSISPQFGPIYQGLIPAHHPIVASPTGSAAESAEEEAEASE
jgi:hypothetical protein